MLKSKNIAIVFLFSVLGWYWNSANAQSSISSPYSAFGVGNLLEVNNVRSRTMGGMSIGTRDYFTVNLNNPASYSAFDSVAFIFEGGVMGHYTNLQTENVSEEIASGTLSHLLFGFPITKWWHSSFGLLPYSAVGYDVNDFEYIPEVGNTQYIFNGEGGLSRFFWGNSYKPFDFLSLGVNANYIFGTIDQIQQVTFPDSSYLFSTLKNNTLSVGDVSWDFGMQLHGKIKNKIDYVIGATYRLETDMTARKSELVRSYFGEISGAYFGLDTISYINDESGSVILPKGYGIGFSLARGYNWQIGFDYISDKWSDFRSFGSSDSLNDSQTFKLGGHFIPNTNSSAYYQRIDYRFGMRYHKSNLTLRNTQINDFGITFGMGLPVKSSGLRGSRAMVNVGFEVGRRGTLDNGLIKENYVRAFIGVSIYERWFQKRRYQ